MGSSFAYQVGRAAWDITSQSGRVSDIQLAALAARPDTLRTVLRHREAVAWVPVPPTPEGWVPSAADAVDFWEGYNLAGVAARADRPAAHGGHR